MMVFIISSSLHSEHQVQRVCEAETVQGSCRQRVNICSGMCCSIKARFPHRSLVFVFELHQLLRHNFTANAAADVPFLQSSPSPFLLPCSHSNPSRFHSNIGDPGTRGDAYISPSVFLLIFVCTSPLRTRSCGTMKHCIYTNSVHFLCSSLRNADDPLTL